MFHNQVRTEDDGISDEFGCADLGMATFKEIHAEFEKRIDETVVEGFPQIKWTR